MYIPIERGFGEITAKFYVSKCRFSAFYPFYLKVIAKNGFYFKIASIQQFILLYIKVFNKLFAL